jgi:hypothetical protein
MGNMPRLNKDPLFSPNKTPRDKGATTTSAARAIVDAETSARRAKTEQLRKLRLAREGAEGDREPDRKPPRLKSTARSKD